MYCGAKTVTVVETEVDAAAPAPNALVAVTVKLAAPAVVGVPLMTPVEVLRVRPAGSEPLPMAKVNGPVPLGVGKV